MFLQVLKNEILAQNTKGLAFVFNENRQFAKNYNFEVTHNRLVYMFCRFKKL
jgi:hypothetical protein